MCGISGFHSVKDSEARFKLVSALGREIDQRGYAMAGFVASTEEDDLIFSRKQGSWKAASDEFLMSAAHGDMCMMHSRAPGFGAPVTDAHPFPIVRDDEVVLWGAHNGNFNEAWTCAKEHNRPCTVDSQELFELIADKDWDLLNSYNGWGIAEWVTADNIREVKLSRLSQYSDLVAVSLNEGGTVWASTWQILKDGLRAANLTVKDQYIINDVGRVYVVNEKGLFPTENNRVRFGQHHGWD